MFRGSPVYNRDKLIVGIVSRKDLLGYRRCIKTYKFIESFMRKQADDLKEKLISQENVDTSNLVNYESNIPNEQTETSESPLFLEKKKKKKSWIRIFRS